MALFRPSELARMWALHPKTVALWIREGKLPAIRTPGGQYRVRGDDARACSEQHALPVPRALQNPRGAVVALGKSSAAMRAVARACRERGATWTTWPSAIEGLLAVAAEAADVLVIDPAIEELETRAALRALRRHGPTSAMPVLVLDHGRPPAEAALAVLALLERVSRTSRPRRGARRDRG